VVALQEVPAELKAVLAEAVGEAGGAGVRAGERSLKVAPAAVPKLRSRELKRGSSGTANLAV